MKTSKKLLTVLFALALLCGLFVVSALAAPAIPSSITVKDENGVTVPGVSSFDQIPDGGSLVLTGDVTLSQTVEFTANHVTIDLAGHTLTLAATGEYGMRVAIPAGESELTVLSSVAGGKLVATAPTKAAFYLYTGSLTVGDQDNAAKNIAVQCGTLAEVLNTRSFDHSVGIYNAHVVNSVSGQPLVSASGMGPSVLVKASEVYLKDSALIAYSADTFFSVVEVEGSAVLSDSATAPKMVGASAGSVGDSMLTVTDSKIAGVVVGSDAATVAIRVRGDCAMSGFDPAADVGSQIIGDVDATDLYLSATACAILGKSQVKAQLTKGVVDPTVVLEVRWGSADGPVSYHRVGPLPTFSGDLSRFDYVDGTSSYTANGQFEFFHNGTKVTMSAVTAGDLGKSYVAKPLYGPPKTLLMEHRKPTGEVVVYYSTDNLTPAQLGAIIEAVYKSNPAKTETHNFVLYTTIELPAITQTINSARYVHVNIDLNGQTVNSKGTLRLNYGTSRLYSSVPGAVWNSPASGDAFFVDTGGKFVFGSLEDTVSEGYTMGNNITFRNMSTGNLYGSGMVVNGGIFYVKPGAALAYNGGSGGHSPISNAIVFLTGANSSLIRASSGYSKQRDVTNTTIVMVGTNNSIVSADNKSSAAVKLKNCNVVGVVSESYASGSKLILENTRFTEYVCTDPSAPLVTADKVLLIMDDAEPFTYTYEGEDYDVYFPSVILKANAVYVDWNIGGVLHEQKYYLKNQMPTYTLDLGNGYSYVGKLTDKLTANTTCEMKLTVASGKFYASGNVNAGKLNLYVYIQADENVTGVKKDGVAVTLPTPAVVSQLGDGKQYYKVPVMTDVPLSMATFNTVFEVAVSAGGKSGVYTLNASYAAYADSLLSSETANTSEKAYVGALVTYIAELAKYTYGASANVAPLLGVVAHHKLAAPAFTSAAANVTVNNAIDSVSLDLSGVPAWHLRVKSGFNGTITVTYGASGNVSVPSSDFLDKDGVKYAVIPLNNLADLKSTLTVTATDGTNFQYNLQNYATATVGTAAEALAKAAYALANAG